MFYHVRLRGGGNKTAVHPKAELWKETKIGIHFSNGLETVFYPWSNVVSVVLTDNDKVVKSLSEILKE